MNAMEKQADVKPRIINEGDKFYSIIGKSKVEIPTALGIRVRKLLSIQDSLVEKLAQENENGELIDVLRMLNCRKSAELATDKTHGRDLFDRSLPSINSREILNERLDDETELDVDGKLVILRRIREEINKNNPPVVLDTDLENMLSSAVRQINKHRLPALMHIFSRSNTIFLPVLDIKDVVKMDFVHTFIILGYDEKLGKFHCFHKPGPEINQRMEICELGEILTGLTLEPNSQFVSAIEEI